MLLKRPLNPLEGLCVFRSQKHILEIYSKTQCQTTKSQNILCNAISHYNSTVFQIIPLNTV